MGTSQIEGSRKRATCALSLSSSLCLKHLSAKQATCKSSDPNSSLLRLQPPDLKVFCEPWLRVCLSKEETSHSRITIAKAAIDLAAAIVVEAQIWVSSLPGFYPNVMHFD